MKVKLLGHVVGTFRSGAFPIRTFVAYNRCGRWTAMLIVSRSGSITSALHPHGQPSRHKLWRGPGVGPYMPRRQA